MTLCTRSPPRIPGQRRFRHERPHQRGAGRFEVVWRRAAQGKPLEMTWTEHLHHRNSTGRRGGVRQCDQMLVSCTLTSFQSKVTRGISKRLPFTRKSPLQPRSTDSHHQSNSSISWTAGVHPCTPLPTNTLRFRFCIHRRGTLWWAKTFGRRPMHIEGYLHFKLCTSHSPTMCSAL